MIRVTYTQGNGYHCSCCRTTFQNEEDFENEDQVKEWLIDFEVSKILNECEDDDDKYIDSIVVISEDITEKLEEEVKDKVELLVAKKRGLLQQQEKESIKLHEIENERKEKAELQRLKEKYEY